MFSLCGFLAFWLQLLWRLGFPGSWPLCNLQEDVFRFDTTGPKGLGPTRVRKTPQDCNCEGLPSQGGLFCHDAQFVACPAQANIGGFALPLSKHVGPDGQAAPVIAQWTELVQFRPIQHCASDAVINAQVHAFEPFRNIFQVLTANCDWA